MWQARIERGLAARLRDDSKLLGLDGQTEIIRAALELLHSHAAEERMAGSIEEFYGSEAPPLPVGVLADGPDEHLSSTSDGSGQQTA